MAHIEPRVKGLERLVAAAILVSLACASCAGVSDQPADGSFDDMVADLLPAVERLSGMRATGEIRVETTTPDDVRRYVESRLDVWLPGEELERMQRAYAMLGLLPDTLDLRSLLLALYGEQVAGFYDPETKALYVLETQAAGIEPVLMHELVHAIQDQHANLDSLISQRGRNDRQTAAQAAIEGHATLAMFAWLAESMTGDTVNPATMPDPGSSAAGLFAGNDEFPVFGRAPRIIRETLLFPYVSGASFVQALWRTEAGRVPPFGAFMPQSTEQVLDPRARFIEDRDEPTELSHDDTEGPDRLWENTLGAFETRLFVEEATGATDGARGWDGDRYTLYESATGNVLVWTSIWDDASAADLFAERADRFVAGNGRGGFVRRIEIDGRPGVRMVIGADSTSAPDPAVYCSDLEGNRIAC
jgi:hypothetical protein